MTQAEFEQAGKTIHRELDRMVTELHAREARLPLELPEWDLKKRTEALHHARRRLEQARLEVAWAVTRAADADS